MSTLAQNIRQLMQQKQYDAALQYFKQNKQQVEASSIASNVYLMSDIITALRNTKAYEAAYKFLEIYQCKIDNNTAQRLLLSYGWLLYAHYKHMLTLSGVEYDKIEAQILLTLRYLKGINDSYVDTLVLNLFRICMQRQKQLQQPSYKYICSICSVVDVKKLSNECTTIQVERKGTQVDMELASPQELWYSAYSKALFELQAYQDCNAICIEAQQAIEQLHYNNAVWFKRRSAQCMVALQQYTQAITLYKQILIQKPEWYLKSELGQIYLATGREADALHLFKQAAASPGPINFKVELIEQIGRILMRDKLNALAAKHFYLSKYIRQSENWKISPTLLNNIEQCDSTQQWLHISKDKLKAELSIFWGFEPNKNERCVAAIETLHTPNDKGRSGILQDKNGRKIFFFIPKTLSLYDHLAIGKLYSFAVVNAEKGLKAVKMRAL